MTAYPNENPIKKRNQAAKERSIRIAKAAYEVLKKERQHKPDFIIDIKVFIQATKDQDPEGLGISHMTLFRVQEIHEMFVELSDEFQKRQQRGKKGKRRLAKFKASKRDYHGIKRDELIKQNQMLTEQITNLSQQVRDLIDERDQLQGLYRNQVLYLAKLQETGVIKKNGEAPNIIN